jgi:hypothetical protein
MGNFLNIELIGELNDTPCHPTKDNMVIKTKHNGYKLVDNSTWDSWEIGFIFPDSEKAEYFAKHFDHSTMSNYKEGMLKDNYIFHIIHFKYPKPNSLYADQLKMTKDYKPWEY